MNYFVSSEQIHSNVRALIEHYFNPQYEVDELQEKLIQQTFKDTSALALLQPKQILWHAVVWEIELLPILKEDLEQKIGLAPFHKKFKIISGPCTGMITYDDGEDIFESFEEARERALSWIDKRMGKIDFAIQSNLRL